MKKIAFSNLLICTAVAKSRWPRQLLLFKHRRILSPVHCVWLMSHQTLHLASVCCYNSLLFGEISWADLSKCWAISVAAQHSCHLVLAANRWSSDSISIYADNAGTSCTVWEAHTVYRWLHLLLSCISPNKTPKVAALLSTLWTKSKQNDACHDTKILICYRSKVHVLWRR